MIVANILYATASIADLVLMTIDNLYNKHYNLNVYLLNVFSVTYSQIDNIIVKTKLIGCRETELLKQCFFFSLKYVVDF